MQHFYMNLFLFSTLEIENCESNQLDNFNLNLLNAIFA